MKKIMFCVLCLLLSLTLFSNSLTIFLEDKSVSCEIFVNDKSVGTVSDSLVMSSIDEGSYKVSMFSKSVLDASVAESALNDLEKKARKLDTDKMNEAVKLGTETVYISKNAALSVTIKNKQAINLLDSKKSSSSTCCCLGGAAGVAGGCLLIGGSVTLLGLLGWGIYMLITEGLPDID